MSSPNMTIAAPPRTYSLAVAGGNSREAIDGARASALLAPIIGGDASYEKIVLGGKSFGAEAAAVLAQALRSMPSLTHADFADCIASRETSEALDVLQVLCDSVAASGAKLQTLDLSDNALGVRGIPRIAAALTKQPNLRHLHFNNDGLQAEAVNGLTELIMTNYGGMSGTTDLLTFEIGHNCLEDAGFAALIPLISRSPKWEKLRIATTRGRSGKGEGLQMAKTLLGLKHLTSLALNDNNLGAAAGPVLAQVIAQNPRLKELNLGDIGVEEEGIRAVLQAVAKIQPGTLEHLDVSASELTGSEKFMKPLCAIMRAQASSLKHVKLEDNELKSRGAAKLLRALEGAKNLEYLNLTNNHLGTKVAPQLVAFLTSHPHLRTVHLNGNHFTAAQLDDVRAAVQAGEHKEALQEMSDNDEEDDETEEESEQDEEEEEDEKPAAPSAAVDELTEKVAALGK